MEIFFQPSLARKTLFRGLVRHSPSPPRDLGLQMVSQEMSGVEFDWKVCFQKKFLWPNLIAGKSFEVVERGSIHKLGELQDYSGLE